MFRKIAVAALAVTLSGLTMERAEAFRFHLRHGFGYTASHNFGGNAYYHPSWVNLGSSRYLTAGCPEAIATINQLAPMYPLWSFGTGQNHTGHFFLDRNQAWIETFPFNPPYQPPGWQGQLVSGRFRDAVDPVYPTPIPYYEPPGGTDGVVTYPAEELRWICRKVPHEGQAQATIEHSSLQDTSVPFYWSESENPGVTNGTYPLSYAGVTMPYIKYIGFTSTRKLARINDAIWPYTRTTKFHAFLVRYQIINGFPVVTFLDGFETVFTSAH